MKTEDQNLRGNWTSASAALRDSICSGAHKACLGLPETSSPEAQAGRDTHAWLHWKRQLEYIKPVGVEPGIEPVCDYELAGRCWDMEQKAVAEWLARLPSEAEQYELEVFSEQRFWLDIGGVYAFCHSGQPDGVYRKGRWACIRDSKSGWLEVTPPNSNEQLRDLAVLVAVNSPLELLSVEVGIDQPGAEPQPPCVYDRDTIQTARFLLEKRVIASNDPQAKRTPHPDACRFCRALGTSRCPETQSAVMSMSSAVVMHGGQWPVAEIPSPRLVEAALLAKGVSQAILDAAKAALKANPDAIPGFKLEPNAPNRPISDPGACWARCSTQGMTLEQFMGCVKVGKGDLETTLKEIIRAKTGKKRVDGWTPLWLKLLDGITTEEPKEPSVKRV